MQLVAGRIVEEGCALTYVYVSEASLGQVKCSFFNVNLKVESDSTIREVAADEISLLKKVSFTYEIGCLK